MYRYSPYICFGHFVSWGTVCRCCRALLTGWSTEDTWRKSLYMSTKRTSDLQPTTVQRDAEAGFTGSGECREITMAASSAEQHLFLPQRLLSLHVPSSRSFRSSSNRALQCFGVDCHLFATLQLMFKGKIEYWVIAKCQDGACCCHACSVYVGGRGSLTLIYNRWRLLGH